MIEVGDKVKVTGNTRIHGYTKGDVVTCIRVGDGIHKFQRDDGAVYWLWPGECEPIKDTEHIKLGDKVVVTGDFYHDLNIGDVVTCVELETDGDHRFEGADGATWFMYPGEYELVPELKIEEGKTYTSRDGRRFGPMMLRNVDHNWPWSNNGYGVWSNNGTRWDGDEDTGSDLVAEYIEPQEDTDTIGSRLPSIDMKHGMVLKCTWSYSSSVFSVGTEYVVNGVNKITSDIGGGWGKGSFLCSNPESEFIVVEQTSSKTKKYSAWSNWVFSKVDGSMNISYDDVETQSLGSTKQIAYRGRYIFHEECPTCGAIK